MAGFVTMKRMMNNTRRRRGTQRKKNERVLEEIQFLILD